MTAEEEQQRTRLVLKPRTKPVEEIGKADSAQAAAATTEKKQKEDPFGGAKPRDEFAYQRKMSQLKVSNDDAKESAQSAAKN